jgi:hypothetical protein
MITATHLKPSKFPVSLLVPNGDFYHVTEHLTEAERNFLKRVRSAPAITDFWARDCAQEARDHVRASREQCLRREKLPAWVLGGERRTYVLRTPLTRQPMVSARRSKT